MSDDQQRLRCSRCGRFLPYYESSFLLAQMIEHHDKLRCPKPTTTDPLTWG